MHFPTHEETSQRAYQLWESSGCTGEADTHWFEAERQLREKASTGHSASTAPGSSLHHTLSEGYSTQAVEQREAQQKREARAPQTATHTAPKSVPAATGKPLWSKPHSS